MPERQIMILYMVDIDSDTHKKAFNDLLAAGWQLDRSVHNGVVPLQNTAIYHLIKYTSDELETMQKAQEEKKSFSFKAASLISVPLADVDAKLKEGYEIVADKIYAKEAILVKYQKPEAAKEQPNKEHDLDEALGRKPPA